MTTLHTTVYLNHPAGRWFGFNPASAVLRCAATFDLELADHLRGPALVEAARDVVFEQLNIEEPEQIWALSYRLAGHRSLSVGDVVVIGETAWTVEPIGWKPLAATTLGAVIGR
jgi:hypothetical protein